ncbi:DUF4012 domain-containing protein [Patescibacteria group bacterium]
MVNDQPKQDPLDKPVISFSEESKSPVTAEPVKPKQSKKIFSKLPRPNKKISLALIAIFAFFLLIFTYTLAIGLTIKKPATAMADSLKQTVTAVQNKDLGLAKDNLQSTQDNLDSINKKFKLLSWVRFIPPFSGYINDAQHGLNAAQYGLDASNQVIDALTPYADVLGFSGVEAELNINSAEEKIIFILETLDKISPKLEDIGKNVSLIEQELAQINPQRYPKTIKGKPVRGQLIAIQDSLASSKDTLSNIKPLLSLLPKLLGQEKPQKYLLIFQNEAEIRGSGGFLTAYAILETSRGKITPVLSSDIYDLDNRFGNRLPAPEPIKKYLPLVYNWHLRDMNLSPDFKVAMETFYPNYKSVAQHKDVDGIIAMDTNIVVDLLTVLGKVGVANWGEYHADIVPECNCPQVVYKMEDYATRPTHYVKTDRKGMIGPLMHSILLNVMNSPKKLWPQFIEIGLENIKEKHLMFYFSDEEYQQVAESFDAAGRVKEYDHDYFYLNDTNFAGAKSNMYITQDIEQEIDIASDGTIEKTVTITYTNPEPEDDCNLESGGLCLNGFMRDWVRILVPEGTELIEVLGSEVDATTSKDLGKTIIEAFFELRPESRSKLVFKYRLPFKAEGDYKLLIQKQPGAKNHHYTITLGDIQEEFDLDGDKELTL